MIGRITYKNRDDFRDDSADCEQPNRMFTDILHNGVEDTNYLNVWCPREDLNLQALRHSHLKAACLPNFTTRARLTLGNYTNSVFIHERS